MVADRSTSDRHHNRGAIVLPLGLQSASPCRRSIYRRCWLPALLFEKGNTIDIALAECRCSQLFIR